MSESQSAGSSEADLRERIVRALREIYDPELPVNIYDLGLIYKLDVGDDGAVRVEMTLTTPACPVAGTFPMQVESRIKAVEGVSSVYVEIVWDPPWTREMMSEEAQLRLNLDLDLPPPSSGPKLYNIRPPR